MHVACMGKLISHCRSVPDIVRENYAASLSPKELHKRKRKLDADGVEEASAARVTDHEETTREKPKQGIIVMKDGK